MAGQTVAGDTRLSVLDQLFEIQRQLKQPNGYPFDVQALRSHLQAAIEGRFALGVVKITDIDWVKTYEALGMKFEPGDFAVDSDPKFWDVYVQKGVTPNKIVEVFRGLGVEVNLYMNDLDTNVNNTKRDPSKGLYRVRFMKTVEADPHLAGWSANDVDVDGVGGITLVERLLLGLGYFLATGNHLDVENVTLCSGSRYSDGRVPYVRWYAVNRKLCVDWDNRHIRSYYLRVRAVVS